MKKLLIILLVIILLMTTAGCFARNKVSGPHSGTAPAQAHKGKPGAEADLIPDLKQVMLAGADVHLAGVINEGVDRFAIHMDLKRVQGKVPGLDSPEYNSSLLITTGEETARYTGQYYYDRAKTPIKVEASLYQSGYLAIVEYDQEGAFNGSFGGFAIGPGFTGIWLDQDRGSDYPCQLWAVDSKPPAKAMPVINLGQIGDYEWSMAKEMYGATLSIPVAVGDRFCFRIEGYWRDHTGMVDGVAFFSDDSPARAVFINPGDGLKMDFLFKDDRVEVTSNDLISHYAGANVSLVGNFKKQVGK